MIESKYERPAQGVHPATGPSPASDKPEMQWLQEQTAQSEKMKELVQRVRADYGQLDQILSPATPGLDALLRIEEKLDKNIALLGLLLEKQEQKETGE